MNLPRTFYEDFQSRWPELFRLVEKIAAKLPPVVPGTAIDDNRYFSASADNLTLEMRKALLRVQVRELGRPITPSQADAMQFMDILETMDALLLFVRYGKRTFYVRPDLVPRLAHTNLDIDCSDIHLPFPYCMLVFDDPITRTAAARHWPTAGPISVLLYETVSRDGATKGKRVLRVMPMIAKQFAAKRIIFDTALEGHISSAMLHTATEQLLQILLNALDFIEQPWDEVAHVIKHPSGSNLSKRISKLSYIDIGRRYQPMETPPLGTETGYQLEERIFVRGHGKNQHHGPHNSLIKRIRIAPYWKGPEEAAIAERPYVVGDARR